MNEKSKRMVRAILIDPFACTITEIKHDASDYKNVYAQLTHESMPVDIMEAVYPPFLADGDCIMVDEEGRLKPCDRWLLIEGYPQQIAGKGLVLGVDDEGETADAKTDIETVRQSIRFLHGSAGRFIPATAPWQQPI